jgi:hypothetical protein
MEVSASIVRARVIARNARALASAALKRHRSLPARDEPAPGAAVFRWKEYRRTGARLSLGLLYYDLELGVRVFVPPAPVSLLIVVFERRKIGVFAVVLLGVHAVRLIFIIVPFMIVVMLFVVVTAGGLFVVGAQRSWRHCDRDRQGGTE